MGRDNLIYFDSNLNGGINQAREKANIHELEDALNVWAPDGIVQRRPGYRGVRLLRRESTPTDSRPGNYYGRVLDVDTDTYASPLGNYLYIQSNNAGNIATGHPAADPNGADMMYLGADEAFEAFNAYIGGTTYENENTTTGLFQYWNGSYWASLDVAVIGYTGATNGKAKWAKYVSESLLKWGSGSNRTWAWVKPGDWATTTINAQSAYWIRVLWKDADVNNVTGAGDVRVTLDSVNRFVTTSDRQYYGIWNFQTGFGNQLVTLYDQTLGPVANFWPAGENVSVQASFVSEEYRWISDFASSYADGGYYQTVDRVMADSIINATSVFSTGDLYVVVDGRVRHITPGSGPSQSTDIDAKVEDRDFAVGPAARYDKNLIAQLTTWPDTKFLGFHQNRLWAVTDDGVRWSGPAPFHNVWTALAYEPLEGDNSATTAVASYNQNFHIFKRNSIYRMVFTELDTFQVPHFLPHKVVSGTGCVAHNSIQEINGRLVFLAEDGLKMFDGQQVQKISERNGVDVLEKFGRSISSGKRHLAASVNWTHKSLYLLSVATNESDTNNQTLVWDYDKNQFWIWEFAHDPAFWYTTASATSDEDLYFVTRHGEVMRFDVADHDHGGTIEAYVETQPFGRDGHTSFRARDIYLTANNKAGDVTVTAYGNDERDGESNDYKFTHYKEAQYGTAKFDVDEFVPDRERVRRTGFDADGQQVKLKIGQTERGTDFKVSNAEIGAVKLGRR